MLRLGRVTGLPVVLEGRMIGCVEQSILCPDGMHLRGLTVRRGFGNAKWIPCSCIGVIGDATVIAVRKPEKLPKDCQFAFGAVFDADGLPLGCVTDVYISRSSMRVQALEVSLGPAETFRRGRYIVRRFSVADAPGKACSVMVEGACMLKGPESEVRQ